MGPRRPRELLIGASLVSIEGFLVELQPVPVILPIITPGPVQSTRVNNAPYSSVTRVNNA